MQPHAVDIREAALRGWRGFWSPRFRTNWHEPVYIAGGGTGDLSHVYDPAAIRWAGGNLRRGGLFSIEVSGGQEWRRRA